MLMINISYSYELRAKLSLQDTKKLLLFPGDIFSAHMIIWSTKEGDSSFVSDVEQEISKLVGNKILKSIYVIDISDVSRNETNVDVLEFNLSLALIDNMRRLKSYRWNIGKHRIRVELEGLLFAEKKIQPTKKYIILDQVVKKEANTWWYKLLIFVIAVSVGGYKVNEYLKIKKENKILKDKLENSNYWKNKFESAQTREQLEEIYRIRKSWRELKIDNEKVDNFFVCINEKQYKQQWTEYEMYEVKESLKKITESIECQDA